MSEVPGIVPLLAGVAGLLVARLLVGHEVVVVGVGGGGRLGPGGPGPGDRGPLQRPGAGGAPGPQRSEPPVGGGRDRGRVQGDGPVVHPSGRSGGTAPAG